ncbi:MAG: hypothetical protein ACRDWE_06900 [Acidimicrobiales bacterium]
MTAVPVVAADVPGASRDAGARRSAQTSHVEEPHLSNRIDQILRQIEDVLSGGSRESPVSPVTTPRRCA